MDEVRDRPPTSFPPGHRGWGSLSADLRALEGGGDLSSRRRGVALRLIAAGVTPELLEGLLPGWSRFLREPGSVDTDAVA